jgi:hypothetical protein
VCRFLVLLLLPAALLLTPPVANALIKGSSSAAAATFLRPLGARAYAGCLLASLAASLLAIRDKHGAPPLRGVRAPGGLARLQAWVSRAAAQGVAGDATLAAWSLLFFVHRAPARVGVALVPLAVAAAVQEDDKDRKSGGACIGRYVSLPPQRLVAALVQRRLPLPLLLLPSSAAAATSAGLVATALHVTLVRFPLAMVAGAPGSARAAGLLAYYLWTLLRARKRAGLAADEAAWSAVGRWVRPRLEAVPQLAPASRVLELLRVKWWDAVAAAQGGAPGGGGGGGGGGGYQRR